MEKTGSENAIVEFVGTFALIFVGAGRSSRRAGRICGHRAGAWSGQLGSWSLPRGRSRVACTTRSLTIALVRHARIGVSRGAYYIVAQLLGALVAALALKAIFPGGRGDCRQARHAGRGADFGVIGALLAEIIMTSS